MPATELGGTNSDAGTSKPQPQVMRSHRESIAAVRAMVANRNTNAGEPVNLRSSAESGRQNGRVDSATPTRAAITFHSATARYHADGGSSAVSISQATVRFL